MRRIPFLLLFAAVLGAAFALPALGQDSEGPVVDVVEIAGPIDRPLERYALERLSDAERREVALLVFQVDSVGGLKISHGADVPPLIARVRDARIPVAVHVGPRGARAAGAAAYLATAAHVASMGPSARFGPVPPVDVADEYQVSALGEQRSLLTELAAARGRRPTADLARAHRASVASEGGLVDVVVPSVAELLRRVDGRTVQTAAGPATLRLPENDTVVRFFQPGPIRRLLHAFANPALVYLTLLAAALLLVFELFQPGFGVAGGTAALLSLGAIYGLTVLPARWQFVALLAVSLVLLTLDVARDELLVPTAVGAVGLVVSSIMLFPAQYEATRLSPLVIGAAVASSLIFFVPVMTMVRRARRPIGSAVRTRLVGAEGEVRSVLNPEGFVLVDDEVWRARNVDGSRLRLGERVVVTGIDGQVLLVRAGEQDDAPTPAESSFST